MQNPLVTIGIPVRNRETSISAAAFSALNQTYRNVEIIISDDASTDGTRGLIEYLAARDPRVKLDFQRAPLGLYGNFKRCVELASGSYFMWLASDDEISHNFVQVNLDFLLGHPEYVGSGGQPCFRNSSGVDAGAPITLDSSSVAERVASLVPKLPVSHGLFYSLFRTEVVQTFRHLGESYLAADWSFDIYVAGRGKVNSSPDSQIFFGTDGVSRQTGALFFFCETNLDRLYPFQRFLRFCIDEKIGAKTLLRLILLTLKMQLGALIKV